MAADDVTLRVELTEAAEQDADPQKAQFLLACMHAIGLGGPEDIVEAMRLLTGLVEADGAPTFQAEAEVDSCEQLEADDDDAPTFQALSSTDPSPEAEMDSREQLESYCFRSSSVTPDAADCQCQEPSSEADDVTPDADAAAGTRTLSTQPAGWQCLSCSTENSGGDEVCTGTLPGGTPCNSLRATGLELNTKRNRGASSSSAGANPKVARGGASVSKTSGRSKAVARAKPGAAAALLPVNEGLLGPTETVKKAINAREAALRSLNHLIGIDSVKTGISRLCNLVIFNEKRRVQEGKEPPTATHHMLFLGNSGTGKTTVAKIVSKMLFQIGIVKKETPALYDNARNALVDSFVGGTAPKSAAVFESAKGGVIFLDEARHFDWHAAHLHACRANPNNDPSPTVHQAYSLIPMGGVTDFSQEAIGVLLTKAEEQRDDTVIILAGYSADMEKLLACNQGLTSRFPNRLAFTDYEPAELMAIVKRMAEDDGDVLAEDALVLLQSTLLAKKLPSNGRDVRNLLERAKSKRADRVVGDNPGGDTVWHGMDTLIAADFTLAATPLAATALTATPLAASTALATLDGSSSAAATDGDDAHIEARALPQPS